MDAISSTGKTAAILWRRLDLPGHEYCRLLSDNSRHFLEGTALFLYEGQPCRLDYQVTCDAVWNTLSAEVRGQTGTRTVDFAITATAGRWSCNGVEFPALNGCSDIDLNFSPSTNLLPIRRLRLAVGREANARAAWLTFPGFSLEAFDQVYRRTGPMAYRYSSADGTFSAGLTVNSSGMVVLYPGLWQAE